MTSEFARVNFDIVNSSELTGVWDSSKIQIALLYENNLPDVTGFNITAPLVDSEHMVGASIEVIAIVLPANAYQQEFTVVAGDNVELVDDNHVKVIEAGTATFTVRSKDLPSVSTTSSIIGVDSIIDGDDVSGFSLDNTKQELQDELVRRGVDFKTQENKQSLIDKINA